MNEAEFKILYGMIEECEAREKFWDTKIGEYVKNDGECTYKSETFRGLSRFYNQAYIRKCALLDFVDRVSRMEEENGKTPEGV